MHGMPAELILCFSSGREIAGSCLTPPEDLAQGHTVLILGLLEFGQRGPSPGEFAFEVCSYKKKCRRLNSVLKSAYLRAVFVSKTVCQPFPALVLWHGIEGCSLCHGTIRSPSGTQMAGALGCLRPWVPACKSACV